MEIKPGYVIIGGFVLVMGLALCIMIKYATEIKVEDKLREDLPGNIYKFSRDVGVITLGEKSTLQMSKRFPYVAAVIRNSSHTWTFACFGSVILLKWIVTAAHCKQEGAIHRVLLYYDFVRNTTQTYPILYWKIHEHYDNQSLKYDIAIAKLNDEKPLPTDLRSSSFDDKDSTKLVASVWKTVSTMDKRLFLTNDFDEYDAHIAEDEECQRVYGVELDESLFCVSMSSYNDCFIFEFGPLYSGDKIVGIIKVKPKECDVKLAIFTNVSHYKSWILSEHHNPVTESTNESINESINE